MYTKGMQQMIYNGSYSGHECQDWWLSNTSSNLSIYQAQIGLNIRKVSNHQYITNPTNKQKLLYFTCFTGYCDC